MPQNSIVNDLKITNHHLNDSPTNNNDNNHDDDIKLKYQGQGGHKITLYDAVEIPIAMQQQFANQNQLKLENALKAVKLDRDRMGGGTSRLCSCKLNPANKRNLLIGFGFIFLIGALLGIYMYWIVSNPS